MQFFLLISCCDAPDQNPQYAAQYIGQEIIYIAIAAGDNKLLHHFYKNCKNYAN